jgi:hypothetical protein
MYVYLNFVSLYTQAVFNYQCTFIFPCHIDGLKPIDYFHSLDAALRYDVIGLSRGRVKALLNIFV